MFLLIIFIAIIICILMLLLPYYSGLTSVKIESNHHKYQTKNKKRDNHEPSISAKNNNEYGYVSPDSFLSGEENKDEGFLKHSAAALKDRLKLNQEDMPIKIQLNNGLSDHSGNIDGELRKRRKEKLDLNTDPNSYDYDLDELIKEETNYAKEQQQREFYKNQLFGEEKEAMV